MAKWLYIGTQVAMEWNQIGEWLSIGNEAIWLKFKWRSGNTLAVKWHRIRTRLVQCLSIGNQVTKVVFQWLSGNTLALKWHWIGIRSVQWLSIGNQAT